MMHKTGLIILLSVAVLNYFVSLFPLYASDFGKSISKTTKVNSYELFFPIVAGTLPTDKKYIFKVLRDLVIPYFTQNTVKKVKIYTDISNKRLLEAEQMLLLGRNDLAENCLIKSAIFLKKAIKQAEKANKEDAVILVSFTILETVSKQETFLPYLARDKEESILNLLEQNYKEVETIKNDANNLLFKYLHP